MNASTLARVRCASRAMAWSLPGEGRRLEEDEDDGEEDEEGVREHHPEAVEDVPGELKGPGGAHVVEDAGPGPAGARRRAPRGSRRRRRTGP